MQTIKVTANARNLSGKGPARRLRRSGEIPAVAYGKQLPSTPLSVSPKALLEIIGSEFGRNSVLEIDLQGERSFLALLSDYQYHPVTRELLHADFLAIQEGETVDVDVPFEPTGRPKGVVLGGVLRQVYRKLRVRCLPKDIPVKIVHDITELELDDSVSVKDLALPEGVTVRLAPEQTVLAVVGEKRRGEGAEEGAAAEAGKPGAAKPGS